MDPDETPLPADGTIFALSFIAMVSFWVSSWALVFSLICLSSEGYNSRRSYGYKALSLCCLVFIYYSDVVFSWGKHLHILSYVIIFTVLAFHVLSLQISESPYFIAVGFCY